MTEGEKRPVVNLGKKPGAEGINPSKLRQGISRRNFLVRTALVLAGGAALSTVVPALADNTPMPVDDAAKTKAPKPIETVKRDQLSASEMALLDALDGSKDPRQLNFVPRENGRDFKIPGLTEEQQTFVDSTVSRFLDATHLFYNELNVQTNNTGRGFGVDIGTAIQRVSAKGNKTTLQSDGRPLMWMGAKCILVDGKPTRQVLSNNFRHGESEAGDCVSDPERSLAFALDRALTYFWDNGKKTVHLEEWFRAGNNPSESANHRAYDFTGCAVLSNSGAPSYKEDNPFEALEVKIRHKNPDGGLSDKLYPVTVHESIGAESTPMPTGNVKLQFWEND